LQRRCSRSPTCSNLACCELQAPQFGSWSQAQGNKPAAGTNGAAKSAAQQSEIDLDFQMLASYLMDEPIAQGMLHIHSYCLEMQLLVSVNLTYATLVSFVQCCSVKAAQGNIYGAPFGHGGLPPQMLPHHHIMLGGIPHSLQPQQQQQQPNMPGTGAAVTTAGATGAAAAIAGTGLGTAPPRGALPPPTGQPFMGMPMPLQMQQQMQQQMARGGPPTMLPPMMNGMRMLPLPMMPNGMPIPLNMAGMPMNMMPMGMLPMPRGPGMLPRGAVMLPQQNTGAAAAGAPTAGGSGTAAAAAAAPAKPIPTGNSKAAKLAQMQITDPEAAAAIIKRKAEKVSTDDN
jgi:hypothetical protein